MAIMLNVLDGRDILLQDVIELEDRIEEGLREAIDDEDLPS